MTDDNQKTVKKGEKPAYRAVQPVEYGSGENKGTHWVEVGAAWLLNEKEGLRVKLHAIPVNGEFILMPPKPENAGN
jgi:hypothetical protein